MNEVYRKLGQLLKLERERKNIPLSDLSDELKISETNLKFIENGEVDLLPSQLYFNLFAKSYAKALNIDFTKTIEAIREDLGLAPEDETEMNGKPKNGKPGKDEPESRKKKADTKEKEKTEEEPETKILGRKFINFVLIIIGVFLVFIVVYLIFFDADKDTRNEEGQPMESTEHAAPIEQDQNLNAELANFKYGTPDYSKPQPIKLSLTAREECWATVYADGDTIIFRNLVPWKEYDVEANYRIRMTIAQPSVVETKLNGKKVDLRNPQTRRISQLEINQINLDSILNAPPPEFSSPTTARPARTESDDNDTQVTDTTAENLRNATNRQPSPGNTQDDTTQTQADSNGQVQIPFRYPDNGEAALKDSTNPSLRSERRNETY